MTTLYRAQATFAHASGLPRDNVSMSFWFAPQIDEEASMNSVATRVRDFFINPVAPAPEPLASHLASNITNGGHTVKIYSYDMATGDRKAFKDAPPEFTLGFALGGIARDTGEGMPSEVSCCLSFRNNSGATPGGGNFGTPPARRRGRVYFGPCTVDTSAPDASLVARPTATLIARLNAAGFVLIGSNPPDPWVIYSRPYAGREQIDRPNRPPLPALAARTGQAYVVEQTWVDNAWDTQRRRGEKATARTFGE